MTEPLTLAKQAVILDAARKRFAYYGFSKVTMDEIAADIGMGKASLYYYFPTKESLFEQVIKQEVDQFFEGIEFTLSSRVPACDMIRKYAADRLRHFRTLANLRALGFQQPKEVRGSILEIYRDFREREVKILQQVLQAGRKSGELEISDPRVVAEAVIQMLYGPRAWLLKKNEQQLDDETYRMLEQSTRIIVEIILRGIKKRK